MKQTGARESHDHLYCLVYPHLLSTEEQLQQMQSDERQSAMDSKNQLKGHTFNLSRSMWIFFLIHWAINIIFCGNFPPILTLNPLHPNIRVHILPSVLLTLWYCL